VVQISVLYIGTHNAVNFLGAHDVITV